MAYLILKWNQWRPDSLEPEIVLIDLSWYMYNPSFWWAEAKQKLF